MFSVQTSTLNSSGVLNILKSKSLGSGSNELSNSASIFNRVKNACSQIMFIINGIESSGSGWFYYDTVSDLSSGYFITAAHCVMQISGGVLYRATELYVTNPITNKWYRVNPNLVYYDGVGDIALIKTNIDFTNYPQYCLRLASTNPVSGEFCYVIGNPAGVDEDSISFGTIRDSNYMDPGGAQITNTLFVSAPGVGGNSGGPILNLEGNVIGIFTFGMTGNETFGGGSNRDVLQSSLSVLKTLENNTIKRYLGMNWILPPPFLLENYYVNQSEFNKKGVYILEVSESSPFNGILESGDILLECIMPTNEVIQFGSDVNQRTPGVLIYYYTNITVDIRYIKSGSTIQQTQTVTLNKSYNDVSPLLDGPLQGGLSEPINSKLYISKNQME